MRRAVVPPSSRPGRSARFSTVLLAAGAAAAAVAAGFDLGAAGAASSQDWPPFVLVSGLLMVGKVAAEDGVFEAAGSRLEAAARGDLAMYAGAMVLVAIVSVVLNLDTAVTFLTPITLAAARRRERSPSRPPAAGGGPGPALLYGCLLVSNAASLLLPGSNLTNLIVLGQLHLSGGSFAARTAAPWAVAVAITMALVGAVHWRDLRSATGRTGRAGRGTGAPAHPRPGLAGILAVATVVVLVLALSSPALPVLAVGLAALAVRRAGRADDRASGRARTWGRWRQVVGELALPVLGGLFGIAVAAGTLGRAWDGPSRLLAHLDGWSAAALAAVLSVAVNNLPAASLLAARPLSHPLSVLAGLDLGPNLAVTGSLSSLLWWQAARRSGWRPNLAQVSRMGLLMVPLSLAAAEAVLLWVGHR
jgi:arsenical pump membrane protein